MLSKTPARIVPAFSWAAARVAGASHEASGTPCQDALALRAGRCGGLPYVVAAVADGAGSAIYAEDAARLATREFTGFIFSEIADWGLDGLSDLLLDAAYGVHCKLRRLASERSVHANHFATTLLGVVITPERSAFIQIGDGGIAVGPPWRLVLRPQRGLYHNETFFLSDADAPDRFQQAIHEGPTETVALFTDGLEDLLVRPASLDIHPPLFDDVAANLARGRNDGLNAPLSAQLTGFLQSGEIRSRTHDDTTFLAIQLHGDRS